MKMKKLLSIMLSLVMVLALAACGNSSDSADDASADAPEDKVYNIGVCQLLEHVALDQATDGFQDACDELFGEGKVKVTVQNGQGEQAVCSTIVNQFISDDVDLIMANATLPLQTAASATGEIPILGTSITDYATALGISDWTGVTGANISGTTDLAPLAEQENMLVEMFPDVKQVGIVYTSSEANSQYQADVFAKELEADEIAYKKFTCTDSNDLASVVTAAVAECDVLYIPTDNNIANNTTAIHDIVVPAGVPVIAGEAGICGGCGVATLSISYYDIGYMTGEMAYEILVNGADITTMEVQSAPNVTKMYNPDICEALGITPPEGYEAIE